jgi:hypothetical protein
VAENYCQCREKARLYFIFNIINSVMTNSILYYTGGTLESELRNSRGSVNKFMPFTDGMSLILVLSKTEISEM